MKKRSLATCLLLSLSIALAGCSGTGAKEGQNKVFSAFEKPLYSWENAQGDTVTLWAKENELNRTYMKKAFERYENFTGGTLRIVEIPAQDFDDKVKDAFNGGNEQPDLLLSYGGCNVDAYRPDDNFYDFTNAQWVDDLTRTSINQTIYNGKVIGLPHWEASISGTLYNKQIFERLHLQVPHTQEEFLNICDTLLQNGITPVYLPYAEVSMLLYQFPLDTPMQDSDILHALNSGALSYSAMPEMKKIVEWYRVMAERGYFGNDFEKNDWSGMNNAMESGEYAMMLCWDTWLYTDFTGDASQFGLMPAFMGVPEEGTFEGPNLALLIANRNSPNLSAALNLITFLADPYNYNAAFEGIYTAPVFKNQIASISTPQYASAERLINKNYLDSTAWLRIKGFSQMDASFIQQYMTGKPGYSVNDCLRDMDAARKSRIQ